MPTVGGGGGGGGEKEREERGERREKRRNEREKRGKERERGGPYYPSATQMVFICSMHNKTPNNLDKSSEGRATANALNHTIRWCSFVVCTTKPHHNLDKSSEGRATANALNHTIRWCSFVVCTTKPLTTWTRVVKGGQRLMR